jgi:hypothetical protein
MDSGRFDAVSRAFALGALPRRGLWDLAMVAMGSTAGWLIGRNSLTAKAQSLCSPSSVANCITANYGPIDSWASACRAQCLALADPTARAQACRACSDNFVRRVEGAVLLCHAQACGSKGEVLCQSVPNLSGVGFCCPFGHLPKLLPFSPSVPIGPNDLTCAPFCNGLSCSPPFKLDTKYCGCGCDVAAVQCPTGTTLNLATCQCA